MSGTTKNNKVDEGTPIVNKGIDISKPQQSYMPEAFLSPHQVKPAKIGLLSFSMLAFYSVSGGPFGIEDIVRAGGPFYALLGFSLLLVWALPEALITAELSTAYPEASGSVAWVEAAFGPFWAFQKGWLSWASGVADNALYPILFFDCMMAFFKPEAFDATGDDGAADTSIYRWPFVLVATACLTFLNYRGLDVVGNVALVACVLSLFPFVIFCIVGLPQVEPSRWLVAPPGGLSGVNWRLLLNTFFWNINYWESAACFSAEVDNPGKIYPRGMALAVLLVFVSLFLPVLIGTGVSKDHYSAWTDGYFVHLSYELAGPWLAYLMMFGAAVTNVGMFEAEMSSDAWQVAGMADKGILPKVLGERNKYGVPTYGVLLSATGVILMGCMSFTSVIDMLNLLYCVGQIIEFFAFIHLRRTKPDLHRPYSVPLGTVGCAIMLSFPLAFILIILSFSSTASLIFTVVLSLVGVAAYYVLEHAKKSSWCMFDGLGAYDEIELVS